jgi:hypothetical protein
MYVYIYMYVCVLVCVCVCTYTLCIHRGLRQGIKGEGEERGEGGEGGEGVNWASQGVTSPSPLLIDAQEHLANVSVLNPKP